MSQHTMPDMLMYSGCHTAYLYEKMANYYNKCGKNSSVIYIKKASVKYFF